MHPRHKEWPYITVLDVHDSVHIRPKALMIRHELGIIYETQPGLLSCHIGHTMFARTIDFETIVFIFGISLLASLFFFLSKLMILPSSCSCLFSDVICFSALRSISRAFLVILATVVYISLVSVLFCHRLFSRLKDDSHAAILLTEMRISVSQMTVKQDLNQLLSYLPLHSLIETVLNLERQGAHQRRSRRFAGRQIPLIKIF